MQFKNSKSYGVLHTENYFSFLGFAKKVNSDEIQKLDIYLDDVLIDTITADKYIQKIDDIYELDNFGFEYTLANEYVGKKSIISFRNHETNENLQNSPYTLIDESHPKFNEYKFIHSLILPIHKKETIQINYKNYIGFLLSSEELKNKDFIQFIFDLSTINNDIKIKIFYFETSLFNKLSQLFNDSNKFSLSIIDHIKNIDENLNIFCVYSDGNRNNLLIKKFIIENTSLLPIIYDKNFANSLISIYDKNFGSLYSPFTSNCLELKNIIKNSPHKTVYKYIFDIPINDIDFNKKTFKDFYMDTYSFSNKNLLIRKILISASKEYFKYYGN